MLSISPNASPDTTRFDFLPPEMPVPPEPAASSAAPPVAVARLNPRAVAWQEARTYLNRFRTQVVGRMAADTLSRDGVDRLRDRLQGQLNSCETALSNVEQAGRRLQQLETAARLDADGRKGQAIATAEAKLSAACQTSLDALSLLAATVDSHRNAIRPGMAARAADALRCAAKLIALGTLTLLSAGLFVAVVAALRSFGLVNPSWPFPPAARPEDFQAYHDALGLEIESLLSTLGNDSDGRDDPAQQDVPHAEPVPFVTVGSPAEETPPLQPLASASHKHSEPDAVPPSGSVAPADPDSPPEDTYLIRGATAPEGTADLSLLLSGFLDETSRDAMALVSRNERAIIEYKRLNDLNKLDAEGILKQMDDPSTARFVFRTKVLFDKIALSVVNNTHPLGVPVFSAWKAVTHKHPDGPDAGLRALLSNRNFLHALVQSPMLAKCEQGFRVWFDKLSASLRATLPLLTEGPDALPHGHFGIRYLTDLVERNLKTIARPYPRDDDPTGSRRERWSQGPEAYRALSEGRGRLVESASH